MWPRNSRICAKGHLEFETALHETRARLGEINGQFEQRGLAQEKKIVAELKVLESLMRDFAGRISHSAASVPQQVRLQRGQRQPISTPWARKTNC